MQQSPEPVEREKKARVLQWSLEMRLMSRRLRKSERVIVRMLLTMMSAAFDEILIVTMNGTDLPQLDSRALGLWFRSELVGFLLLLLLRAPRA